MKKGEIYIRNSSEINLLLATGLIKTHKLAEATCSR
jgi:hypothetical protein